MRFSILQLLIATSIAGAILGVAARDGIVVASWLIVFAALCGFCVSRARNRWPSSNWLQKVYAGTTAIASSLLLATFIYSVATSSTLANERNTRSLQVALAREPRFAAVNVQYFERKGIRLGVEGSVSTEDDLQSLRQRIQQYHWQGIDGVYWKINVTESKRTYDEWDEDLLVEAKR